MRDLRTKYVSVRSILSEHTAFTYTVAHGAYIHTHLDETTDKTRWLLRKNLKTMLIL